MVAEIIINDKQRLAVAKIARAAKVTWQDNVLLIGSYLVLIAAISWMYVAQLAFPALTSLGELSRGSPWGIVTSIFIHGSVPHVEGNAIALFWMMVSLVVLSEVNADIFRRARRSFLFWGPFVSAAAAGLLFYLVAPNATSFGASGVVYASLGVAVALALAGLVPELTSLVKHQGVDKTGVTKLEINIVFSFPYIALVYLSPSGFLGVGTGANVFIHGAGFMIGLLSGYVYFFVARHRNATLVDLSQGIQGHPPTFTSTV